MEKNQQTVLNRKVLKDFQEKTVNYVFRHLYKNETGVDRFLIADEVGLGKTLVARGVIEKAIKYLKDTTDRRIDIVYICSNSSIARQNVNRLTVNGDSKSAIAGRMTLLPMYTKKLKDNRVNFVSFTPGTSFDPKSTGGIAEERALIYHILRRGWKLGDLAPFRNVLQCDVKATNWKKRVNKFPKEEIDKELSDCFIENLKNTDIRRRFRKLAEKLPKAKQNKNIPIPIRQERNILIGELRSLLAKSCVKILEPDIVILDEFQRFKKLLDGDDEVGELARAVFDYPTAKVILLSATPYKMYTMHHEKASDDHYEDFIRTLKFLYNDDVQLDKFQKNLRKYHDAILDPDNMNSTEHLAIKSRIETFLRKVMVRTERISHQNTDQHQLNNMETQIGRLNTSDLHNFTMLDKIARHLKVGDTVEYWKSAPYLLNIMDRSGYKLKEEFKSCLNNPGDNKLKDILKDNSKYLLNWNSVKKYMKVDPANSRLSKLFDNTVEQGAWKLLWIPPSLPYYLPKNGPFIEGYLKDFTKSIIFSSWMVVPKAIAMLTSYEAERRMVTGFDPEADYQKEKNRPRLLDFKYSRERFTGMSVFPIIYPCVTLAMKLDPLNTGIENTGELGLISSHEMLRSFEDRLKDLLGPVLNRYQNKEGRVDESWYWASLPILDWHYYRRPVREWFDTQMEEYKWSSMAGSSDTENRFDEHIEYFKGQFRTPKDLGRPPDDLIPVLAKVSLASPGVTALRALIRYCKRNKINSSGEWLLSSAARVAMGFRYLFNLPESMTLIRSLNKSDDTRYWESVLDYCVDGNLQSVLDEYTHILRESLGLIDKAPSIAIPEMANEIQNAVSLRTVNLDFDDISHDVFTDSIVLDRHTIRCRFALKFGDGKNEEEKTEIRKDLVRTAFNSPFKPFVLATTSIGQEGLDFHQYCHDIYHWNLPANPVDLEQREGRIHRYKGHMIRRNIAKSFPLDVLKYINLKHKDPWELMFMLALKNRDSGVNDLVPFWIYDVEDGYKLRRYVPTFPLSKDREQLEILRNTLVAYRMVLGQPRQEDLVNYLQSRFDAGLNPDELINFRIDLSPR